MGSSALTWGVYDGYDNALAGFDYGDADFNDIILPESALFGASINVFPAVVKGVLDTGDPAERVCNPKSYTDLGNGIVRDNVTGLEWQKATPSGTYKWQQALDYVAGMNAGTHENYGYTDWRLPTIEELSSLVDAGTTPAIDPVFNDTDNMDPYWSSTAHVYDSSGAWNVDSTGGFVYGNLKTSYSYVRAVRGGQYRPLANFVINGNGTVTDTTTDLMWQQCIYGQTWSGTACTGRTATRTLNPLLYVQELNNTNYLGYGDWRLPTRNEVQSLVDYSRWNPATAFPQTAASGYWSSTAAVNATSNAWFVDFSDGGVYDYDKASDDWYVRAVRGGPCWVDDAECLAGSDCSAGDQCVEGACVPVVGGDNPPAIGAGPYLAANTWPVLPTSAASPMYLDQNYSVFWTFSDDYASCPGGACTNAAEYRRVGTNEWIALTMVNTDPTGKKYAYVELPIESLQNATTYAFRFTVTDCADKSTQSQQYYFRVAITDAPPMITSGPLLAEGPWMVLPTSAALAPVMDHDNFALWTFSDDYAFCLGLCTHRARYRKVGDTAWTWITVSADPTGKKFAYAFLPIESLDTGTYHFWFDVRDCAGQLTKAPKIYYFKVK